MNTLVTAGVIAAAGGAIAALSPRTAYRLAVPPGQPAAGGCHRCGAPFPPGVRGWLPAPQRCRNCRYRLAAPWWAMATIGAAACGLLTARLLSSDPGSLALLLAWILLTQAGLVLSLIDAAVHRLPTPIVVGTAVLTGLAIMVAALLRGDGTVVVGAAIGGAGMGSAYLAIAVIGHGAVGAGDVRLAAVIGLVSGSGSRGTVILAAVTPYVLAFPFAVRRRRARRRDPSLADVFPFGPFLIAGSLVAAVLTTT